MCLIVVGWQAHPDYPWVVAANRDEFHARPTANAARWHGASNIIGGIDLEAGGTWLGVTDSGRFAAVTNVREPQMAKGACSRGALTQAFLRSEASALQSAAEINCADYSGFNLLLCDGRSLVYCSNRNGAPKVLPPGIYGLSNHRLDSPWPKLIKARGRFTEALEHLPAETGFFDLLADPSIVEDENLPDTGVSREWERLLSAVFVKSENYGTRASTLAWQRSDGAIQLHEKSFGPDGQLLQSSLISTAV